MEASYNLCDKVYKGMAAGASLRCHKRRKHVVRNRNVYSAPELRSKKMKKSTAKSSQETRDGEGNHHLKTEEPVGGPSQGTGSGEDAHALTMEDISDLYDPRPLDALELELDPDLLEFIEGLTTEDLLEDDSRNDEHTAPACTFQLTGKVLVAMLKRARRLMDEGIPRPGVMQVLSARFPDYASEALVAVYEGLQPDRSPAAATGRTLPWKWMRRLLTTT